MLRWVGENKWVEWETDRILRCVNYLRWVQKRRKIRSRVWGRREGC